MDFIVFLEELRNAYMVQYESSYVREARQHQVLTPEVAFEISGGVYKNLFVVDFLSKNGEDFGAIEVIPTSAAYLQGSQWTFNQIKFEIGNVTWDAMHLEIGKPPKDLVGFESWFDKWIDLERLLPAPGEEYGHSIHSVTLLDTGMVVDFGTAPTRAFQELVVVFRRSGVEEIKITDNRD